MNIIKKVFTVGVVLTTVVWTMGVATFVPTASAVTLTAGDLIKASGAAVYYYAADGKRYTFPTQSTYMTWYSDFSGVMTITDDELAAIDLAGNVVVRPGTKLIKINTVPKVYAVEPGGMLRHLTSEVAATTLYGSAWGSRVIDIPDGFWPNYTDLSQPLIGDEYPEGQLVMMTGNPNVYYVNGMGEWSLIASESAFNANHWKWSDVVTAPSGFAYTPDGDVTSADPMFIDVSQGGGAIVPPSGMGTLMVSLNPMTPSAVSVPANATAAAANVPFTYVDFQAGSEGATINSVAVTRGGLSQDAALDGVKLFDMNYVQLGNEQGLNSSHQAKFNNLGHWVAPNEKFTVILAADMTASVLYDGNQIQLGIESADQIGSTANVSGAFPIWGNTMTLTDGVTIGTAILDNGSLCTRCTGDIHVNPDDLDVRFTQVKVRAGSGEGLRVKGMTVVKNGSAASDDVKNIRMVNDNTGIVLGTKDSLDSSGRAPFVGLSSIIAKGGNNEFSFLGDMNNSGAGRTIAFDLHDGTDYVMNLQGETYGFGITPTRGNFCNANGTCPTQTIDQGYLTVNLSPDTAPTGNIALGDTQVPLATFDYYAGGEPINVTSTAIRLIPGAGVTTDQLTNVTLYDEDGGIVAGPRDGTITGVANNGTAETLTFTDAYTVPNGLHQYTVMADIQTTTTVAGDTFAVSMPAGLLVAKGQDSGKSTYTTSAGTTVPPAVVVTGKTQTVKGPQLAVLTASTPVVDTFVAGTQDVALAYFDLDATSGGEDAKLTSLVVTQTCAGGGDATDWGNMELWGDLDNTDDDDTMKRIETSNSTATWTAGATSTMTFTFKDLMRVSKTEVSRLALMGDLLENPPTPGQTHRFHVDAAGATATGWSTNVDITETFSATGAGQAHGKAAAGSLLVDVSADRPAKMQLVAGSTGNEVMKYVFKSLHEEIDVTELWLAADRGVDASIDSDVAAVKLYQDGVLLGATGGYNLQDDATSINKQVVLTSGTFIVPEAPSSSTLTMKVDMQTKTNLDDASTMEIGLGDENGNHTDWGADGAYGGGANDNYQIVATGKQSGAVLSQACINETGDDGVGAGVGCSGAGGGTVIASFAHKLYDGLLVIDTNAATPSGTATPGTSKEFLRLDLTAVGDQITINDLEVTNNGTCNPTGTGAVTLKSSDSATTYADWAAGTAWLDSATKADIDVSVDAGGWSSTLQIAEGSTKTVKLFGDTTGCTVNETYQASIGAGTTTASGVAWQNSSANAVDSLLTDELPVYGGTLVY